VKSGGGGGGGKVLFFSSPWISFMDIVDLEKKRRSSRFRPFCTLITP